MTFPLSKIDLVNEALALTGNNLVAVLGDGSDEDTVCSAAYEAGMEYMLDNHDWKQLTTVVVLNPTGVAPTDTQFDTAFAKPPDCIHVIWVRVFQGGSASAPGGGFSSGFSPGFAIGTGIAGTSVQGVPILYQILTDQIIVNFGGAASVITMKYVRAPSGDAGPRMLRTFMTALRQFVMAGIYRGMHKDLTAACIAEQNAMKLLEEARTRSDQEQPKRAIFNSRLTASRRVRRPWPVVPTGWGGSGIPS